MEHFPRTLCIALPLALCVTSTDASPSRFLSRWLFLLSLLICISSLFSFHWLLLILLDNLCYISGTYLHEAFMGVCACDSGFTHQGACTTVSLVTLLGAYVWLCFICGNFLRFRLKVHFSEEGTFCQTSISQEESKNKLLTLELFMTRGHECGPWRACEDQPEAMKFLFPALSGFKVEADKCPQYTGMLLLCSSGSCFPWLCPGF